MEVRNEEIAFGSTLSPIALRNLYDHSAVHLSVEWRDITKAWATRGTDAELRVEVTESSGTVRTPHGDPSGSRLVSGTLAGVAQWAAGRGTAGVSDSESDGAGAAPAPAWI